VSARVSYYKKADDSTGAITTLTVSGAPVLSVRPNALDPDYLAVITDQGELHVFNKDGSLEYSHATGVDPDKISMNNRSEVLVKSGTNIYLINAAGALQFGPVNVAGLLDIYLGDDYVVCCTGSGVEWRSRVAGALVTSTGFSTGRTAGGLCVGDQLGENVFVNYRYAAGNRHERHSRIAGRVNVHDDGSAWTPAYIACSYDAAYVLSNDGNGTCAVFGMTLVLYAVLSVSGSNGCVMNPNGDRAILRSNNNVLHRVIVSPTPSVNTSVRENTLRDIDVSEDHYFIYTETTNIRVLDDSLTLKATIDTVFSNSPIAVVRNT